MLRLLREIHVDGVDSVDNHIIEAIGEVIKEVDGE